MSILKDCVSIVQRAPERSTAPSPSNRWQTVTLEHPNGHKQAGQFVPLDEIELATDWPMQEIAVIAARLELLSGIADDAAANMAEHGLSRIMLPSHQAKVLDSIDTLEAVLIEILEIAYEAGEPSAESLPVFDNLQVFHANLNASRSAEGGEL